MSKNLFIVLTVIFVSIFSACSSNVAPNANANIAVVINTNQANMPPGLSANQIPLSANSTPGIPDTNGMKPINLPKGATPTPGIPDPATIGKTPVPKGATPTPGIPSEAEIKKRLNTPLGNRRPDRKPPELTSNSNTNSIKRP